SRGGAASWSRSRLGSPSRRRRSPAWSGSSPTTGGTRTSHRPPRRERRAPVTARPLGDAVRASAGHAVGTSAKGTVPEGTVAPPPGRVRPLRGQTLVRSGRMDESRDFLRSIGLPGGDLHELPDSEKRFPDGAQYRVEIPSTEGPRCLEAVLEESERLDVTVHRVSQGSGVF